jgi:hypothetical protein
MRDVQKLVAMLRSPKANVRYEACELLRVAPEITPEAIVALENALRDPDPHVAEGAKTALNVHRDAAGGSHVSSGQQGIAISSRARPRDYLIVALLSIILPQLLPMCLILPFVYSEYLPMFSDIVGTAIAFALIPPMAAILVTRLFGRRAGIVAAAVLGSLSGFFFAFVAACVLFLNT